MKKRSLSIVLLSFLIITSSACNLAKISLQSESPTTQSSPVVSTLAEATVTAEVETQPADANQTNDLGPGDEGAEVQMLEEMLFALGYNEIGRLDGIYDLQTAAAVNHFQLMSNLPITGEVDEVTWGALKDVAPAPYYLPPAFPGKVYTVDSSSMMCDDHALQDRLAVLEYITPGSEEWSLGIFGTETRDALIQFQKDINVDAEGIPNLKTWQTLFSPIPHWTFGGAAVKVHRWPTSLYAAESEVIAQAWDGEHLWLVVSRGNSIYDNYVLRIDPNAHPAEAVMLIRTRDCETQYATITNMIFAGEKIWLLYDSDENGNPEPLLQSIDPETGVANKPFKFANCPDGYCVPASAMGVAQGQLWVAGGDMAYSINVSSEKVLTSKPIGFLATGKMVYDDQCLWYQGEAMVTSFNPSGGSCGSSNLDNTLFYGPVETNGKWVWVINYDGMISQLDLETDSTITLDSPIFSASAITYGNGLLWIADQSNNSIVGYSPETNTFGEAIQLQGEEPDQILFAENTLWVHYRFSATVEQINVANYSLTAQNQNILPEVTPPPLVRNLFLKNPNFEGEDIYLLQESLLSLGYYELQLADGVFGPLTDQAVRHFQADHNLVVDGIVGPITWAELFEQTTNAGSANF